jgi:hypothetical protein
VTLIASHISSSRLGRRSFDTWALSVTVQLHSACCRMETFCVRMAADFGSLFVAVCLSGLQAFGGGLVFQLSGLAAFSGQWAAGVVPHCTGRWPCVWFSWF